MELISKHDVAKEMIAVPGEFRYEYYFKEVRKDMIFYHPATVENFLKFTSPKN